MVIHDALRRAIEAEQPIAVATPSTTSFASARPCGPLATFAFFEMTTIARAVLFARCRRLTVTLGPTNRLCVNTPAAAHDESATTRVKSSVVSFTPMFVTWAWKPRGSEMVTSSGYVAGRPGSGSICRRSGRASAGASAPWTCGSSSTR